MPDVTTQSLLDTIAAGPLTAPQAAALDELNVRVIAGGDKDEIKLGGLDTTKGGIRPHHVPIVPA